ncbi:hypothetical protein SK128_016975 [Halocaridina rubra]|uniref:Major facilitator superfamily associated domain-containing protein n=1 Tax=Halocaridina rubra TaxID=373956 RepID=A0AAN9AFN1_HALRR
MMVVARQLGIPVGVQGTITAMIITVTILVKPIISAMADYWPSFRKTIFLALLIIMVVTLGPIGFFPPMYSLPVLSGRLLHHMSPEENVSSGKWYLIRNATDSCLVTAAWDCKAACQYWETCPIGNDTLEGISLIFRDNMLVSEEMDFSHNILASNISYDNVTSDVKSEIYQVNGLPSSINHTVHNIRIKCAGGERSGDSCLSPWYTLEFWLYVILFLAGQVSATTVESISDAICLDTIGENGNYGAQRAWGALSYGILGTLSGVLVDWQSGLNVMKDYTPAFLLLVVFGTLDVLLSAAYLKVSDVIT